MVFACSLCRDLVVCTSTSKTKDGAFCEQLRSNLNLVLLEVQSHPELEHLLNGYFGTNALHDDLLEGSWNFVEWCLVLIHLLSDVLQKYYTQKETETLANACGAILSISQQKTVEKCIQFIVALGLLPNLLPGVGQPLKERSEFADMVENMETSVSPQTKHRRLVTCLKVLLNCTKETTLQSIIITRHAGDLLPSLFQLCYAPIKRIDGHEPSDFILKENSCLTFDATSYEYAKYSCCKNDLMLMLESAADKSIASDNELIYEMWRDRQHFLLCLNKLLKMMCLPVLIWELLLQASPKKCVTDEQTKLIRSPLWLRKACNDLLIEKISEPHGVKSFADVILDKISGIRAGEKNFDQRKIDAVARLVSGIPVKKNMFDQYIRNVSNQVIELLHSRGPEMDPAFGSVASVIVLHFIQNYPTLAGRYILQTLFRAFWKCLDFKDTNQCAAHMIIANEEELSMCIEDAYQIFVECGSAAYQQCNQLLPFFHLLFNIFSEIQNGISYLRPIVFSLLVTVVNNVTTEEAVDLMNLVCFDDLNTKVIHHPTGLKYISGETGGISAIYKCEESSEEMLILNKRYQPAKSLLLEASHKDMKISFFLNLLKKLKEIITKEKLEDTDIQNSFMMLQFLQELVEVLGEELVRKTTDIIFFVNGFLINGIEACAMKSCNQLSGSESLMFALIILDTFVGYKDQLSSLDWKAIKQCVPYLKKLSESVYADDSVKEMSQNMLIAISTHGAVHYKMQKDTEPAHCTGSMNINGLEGRCEQQNFKIPSEVKSKNSVSEKTPLTVIGNVTCSAKDEENLDFLSNSKKSINIPSNGPDYQTALIELKDPLLPVRGHGLLSLTHLILMRDKETLLHKDELLEIFKENIVDEDSYIYLAAIRGLSELANIFTEQALPVLIDMFINMDDQKWQQKLKIGEVLMKVSGSLGEMTVKYQNTFMNAFLHGAKSKTSEIRMSSLSNLAEVCQQLKWSIQSIFYEVFQCVDSVLKTDKHVGVRRSAASVLPSMLKGMEGCNILVTPDFAKELFSLIKNICHNDKDEIVQLHAQMAREEIRRIIKDLISTNAQLVKKINVLDYL